MEKLKTSFCFFLLTAFKLANLKITISAKIGLT